MLHFSVRQVIIALLIFFGTVEAADQAVAATDTVNPWLKWLGHLHIVLVHYPIALVVMALVAEVLFSWTESPTYDDAARFMLISAVILAIPTLITGQIFSLEMEKATAMASYLWWHRVTGLIAMSLLLITVFLRYLAPRKWYLTSLVTVVILTSITAYLGGVMAWGPNHLLPPIS